MGKTVRVNVNVETVRHWLSAFREELEEESDALERDTRKIGAPLTATFYRASRSRSITGEVMQGISNMIAILSLLPDGLVPGGLTLGAMAELADEELPGTDEAEVPRSEDDGRPD